MSLISSLSRYLNPRRGQDHGARTPSSTEPPDEGRCPGRPPAAPRSAALLCHLVTKGDTAVRAKGGGGRAERQSRELLRVSKVI